MELAASTVHCVFFSTHAAAFGLKFDAVISIFAADEEDEEEDEDDGAQMSAPLEDAPSFAVAVDGNEAPLGVCCMEQSF